MPHPRLGHIDRLTLLRRPARELGYHMPAEWEPQARVWVSPPHLRPTWPGCLGKAQEQFRGFLSALRGYVEVAVTQNRGLKTDDSWIRDYGPIFVVRPRILPAPQHGCHTLGADSVSRQQGVSSCSQARLAAPTRPIRPSKALHDFRFNCWGGKYAPRKSDDLVPQRIARQLGVPLWVHDMVLEGGSIDVNGRGTVLTTEQCLLNPNRNPRMSRRDIERALHDALGTRHIIWLPGGIAGDDTDGHVDDLARFVAPGTVVACVAPSSHPDHDMLDRNRRVLIRGRDQDGRKLTVIDLPMPRPIFYDFPVRRWGPRGRQPVPASYANFLIANGGVFVPVFGQKSDARVLRILEQALPRHKVIPVRAEYLVVGLGALHCLTQQEPV